MPSNPASALGEAVGKLFERGVIECLKPEVRQFRHKVAPERLRNGSDNVYQIDAVVSDADGRPILIVDPKYIRYTKHNRDKASWLCTAHYNLRKTYPTLRKSVAVLGGRWSNPSLSLLDSFGVEIVSLPFEHFRDVLHGYGVEFDWDEGDRVTPRSSFDDFQDLGDLELQAIANELVAPIETQLVDSVVQVLSTSLDDVPHHVERVEILIKTDQNEMILQQHDNIREAMSALSGMIPTQTDVSELLP